MSSSLPITPLLRLRLPLRRVVYFAMMMILFLDIMIMMMQEVHGFVVDSSTRRSSKPIQKLRSSWTSSTSTSTSTSTFESSNDNNHPQESIPVRVRVRVRLNKVFKATHSRREADKLITSGRIAINGQPIVNKGGCFVIPYQDEITLDGKVIQNWERMNDISRDIANTATATATAASSSTSTRNRNSHGDETAINTNQYEYVKYYKPIGVTCTTDFRIRENIISSIKRKGYQPRHRVYPIGRLDKETSGLIIITSDGRLVNAALRGEKKQPKVYKVMVDGRLSERDLQQLRDGIVIKTVAQRDGKISPPLIAKTKECKVEKIGPCSCQMTLVEGRNRQIRKMMDALGYNVIRLQRVEFMGIYLGTTEISKGLEKPGDWAVLDEHEMQLVREVIQSSSSSAST